jgi:hypothetical protein
MRVVQQHDGEWRVEGQGSERAVLAFAVDAGDHVEYDVRPALKLIASQNKAPRASRIP